MLYSSIHGNCISAAVLHLSMEIGSLIQQNVFKTGLKICFQDFIMASVYYVVVNSVTDRTVFSLYFVGVFCQCDSVTMVNLFITSIPGSYFQAHI